MRATTSALVVLASSSPGVTAPTKLVSRRGAVELGDRPETAQGRAGLGRLDAVCSVGFPSVSLCLSDGESVALGGVGSRSVAGTERDVQATARVEALACLVLPATVFRFWRPTCYSLCFKL